MEDKNAHPEQDPVEGSRETVERDLERQSKNQQTERQSEEKSGDSDR
jgi:hypothetical protein